ncbi:MAG: FtsH protease activity modulator HflK [Gallionella sp.]|nr:FtsH protease activity modulator HflK [Gallionella sp.]OIO11071.1 MAG: HflK protein [Gallionellaceae bacterium CG1_02_60_325]PIR10011.1 MAG: FtsH protease activity modulator HflK [Gallionellaceae bacterium CG11_big_fil_rev_8_21_14_0_20_60_62]PIV47954.1 MAG: FtsH protease activity modulator HflK [Gallionellaceae bacterium CG02_land_8_20_14_3_00_60_115]PIY05245.1 MAG: FtsH protease activity modulator HflK [Gallionellaceae bacterium CG_4_10_14_3_um_filter_60_1069]PJC05399.1 MAG: FtsH protease 
MGLNDPQWGKNNSGGPPDLEEVVRNLNRKIESMFGRSGGGSSSGSKSPNGGGFSVSLGLIVLIVALVWLASGFYIVDASQRGVVLRFGKLIETTEPGPRWHLPYPVETVEVVNISQVRTVEVGYRENVKNKMLKESLMLTDDENIIDIQFAVQYFLKDPGAYLFNNRAPDENVRQSAETAIREVVGRSKMDFVLYEGREQVAAETTRLMQDILDRYQSGILVSKITMQNAQPPEQVQAAFDDAVKAGQDRERQKNEGQSYANDVIPKAKGAAARLMEEAAGYKQSVIANAEGDASRFKQILAEYEKAPLVTRERMYLDMMQQIMTSSSKVMIDQKNSNGSLLYLPLDKLMQRTETGAGANATAAAPVEQAGLPASEFAPATRARELLLGREREAR